VLLIIDEDFLLNKQRAMEFRECVKQSGKTLSIFAFSSVKALSQYKVEEILEMGIDGFWIGYEGTRSGYAKATGASRSRTSSQNSVRTGSRSSRP
jgi:hypothetical protein